jgi:uncharacterized protein
LPKSPRHLLDVNVLVALLDEEHVHHRVVTEWFETPGLQWVICPFTEASLLRYMTRPKIGDMSIEEATRMLTELARQKGYHYQPISADWQTLCGPFFKRIFGHKQITDAYLLGLAVREELVLVTFDRAIAHMAGEHGRHVLLLQG